MKFICHSFNNPKQKIKTNEKYSKLIIIKLKKIILFS